MTGPGKPVANGSYAAPVHRSAGPTTTIAALLATIALILALGACGDDPAPPPEGVPAAGVNTPPAGTPGVPEGAPYDVDGTGWAKLGKNEKFAAAEAFIAANPGRCDADADVGIVTFYVTNSYGLDFPPDIPAADVLAEGCDAARQSGEETGSSAP